MNLLPSNWSVLRRRSLSLFVAAGAALAQMPRVGWGQVRAGGGTAAAPALAAAAAPAAPVSADQALEDKLMSTLASRDMSMLLDYYFKVNNVSPERQAVVKSIIAWKRLGNDPTLTAAQKRQLIQDGVRGVQNFLDTTKDTEMLMRRANELIEYAVKAQVSEIEYFGETPTLQSDLHGSADAVVKILDKAATECEAQEAQLLAGQTRPNQAIMDKWTKLDERANTARWTKAFSTYPLVISMDAADEKRKTTADGAIVFLTDFEKPEFEAELAKVKTQIGKLMAAKGDADGGIAKLQEALKQPKIEPATKYEAMFGVALANLSAKRAEPAAASLGELKTWVGTLPAATQKALNSGIGLLDYRVDDLRAELAKDPAEKKKWDQAGEAVLNKLMEEYPHLAPRIKKMQLAKLPADADVTKLNSLLLRSLMARGVDEVRRAGDGLADEKGKPVLAQAIKAAIEIEKRKGQPNVDEAALDESAFLLPIFYQKVGNDVETAATSLEYIKKFPNNKERTPFALANALQAVEIIRKTPEAATNTRIGELIDGAWKLALANGRVEYAFLYGKRLIDHANDDPAKLREAAAVLNKVPDTSKSKVHAEFFELSALQDALDDKTMDAATRTKMVEDIQKLAASVNQRIDQSLLTATEEQKPRLRYYQVQAILLAAELKAKEMKDFQGVLTALNGFEEKAKVMPKQEATLMGTALRLRVNAYMGLGKTQEAVSEVQKLVDAGGVGVATILFTLVSQMDESYDKAKANKDLEGMRQAAATEVALIGPLINQTKDEKARVAYEKWEARLLIRIALIEPDADKKKAYLARAQTVFARELAKAEEGSPERDGYRYQLALISYQLGDYKKVQMEMGTLIAEGRLGAAERLVPDPAGGPGEYKDNPVYWEGLLRFMQANLALYNKTPNDPQLKEALENARQTLKAQYINKGKHVGGPLAAEYQVFKKELLGDWDETKIDISKAATRPTTKPTTAAAAK